MSMSKVVNKVLTRQNDFCCVCLNVLDAMATTLENEVVVNINNVENRIVLFDVLSTILNDETVNYISGFNCLCSQCTQMAVSSYVFLKKAKENAELLTKVIEGLTCSVTNINKSFSDASLYITLNTKDFSTKQYCDTKRVGTVTSACKRLTYIVNNNVKLKPEHKYIYKARNKNQSHIKRIPNEQIMYDPNDTQTIKCKECMKVYPTIWNLRSHYIRVHAPKIYKCSECPMKYGSMGCLKTHKAESHCTVVCSVCGKVFRNRHTLKMHELGHHLRLVCQKCGRIYKNKNTFNKHIEYNVCGKESRASPSDAKFECDYCGKKYTQKISLRIHIQFEHGNYKSYNCKWCEKRFWCQSRLNAHVVKHTQEKKFHCSTCDRNFVTKESLLYHTRIHTGEKPYECSLCEDRFLSASRRSEHVKRHHGGGKFQCDVCHSRFNSLNYLQKHKRIHLHGNRDKCLEPNHEYATKNDVYEKPIAAQSQPIIPETTPVYNFDDIYFEVETEDYNSIKVES